MTKCTLQGCEGHYERRLISHVFTHNGTSVVIEGIPALVCDVCGDTILEWNVVQQLLTELEEQRQPVRFAPV